MVFLCVKRTLPRVDSGANTPELGNRGMILAWAAGAVVALLVCWGAGAIFLDSEVPRKWDPDIQSYLPAPGTVRRYTSEGWGISRIGTHGISGIPDITSIPQMKVAIWGTSMVEGVQVHDHEKMAQVLTSLFRKRGRDDLVAVGVARPFTGVVDHYFKIPRFERIAHSVVAHLIVIDGVSDLVPQSAYFQSKFITHPEFRFIEGERPRPPLSLAQQQFLYDYHLQFHQWFVGFFGANGGQMNFWPSRTQDAPIEPEKADLPSGPTTPPVKEWRFLLDSFRDITNRPLCFVHAHPTPNIVKGRISHSRSDPLLELFRKECQSRSIGFLDLTSRFEAYYARTGQFPHGFSTSRPAAGHFNANGHRLIAEAMFEWLTRDHHDLLHD